MLSALKGSTRYLRLFHMLNYILMLLLVSVLSFSIFVEKLLFLQKSSLRSFFELACIRSMLQLGNLV